MLKHKGFHCGNFGLWDPRPDVCIFDHDSIKKFEAQNTIPKFFDKVISHEMSHRWFYNTKAVKDVHSLFHMMNTILRSDAESLGVRELKPLMAMLSRTNKLMDEIDPILDAVFAIGVYHDLEQWKKSVGKEAAIKILASSLNSAESKKAFDALLWLYDRSSFQVPYVIVTESLGVGILPFGKVHREEEMMSVKDMFYGFIDSLQTIYEANQKKAEDLLNNVSKWQETSAKSSEEYDLLRETFFSELKRYWPDVAKKVDIEDLEFREKAHKFFTEWFHGKDFSDRDPNKLRTEGPLLTVIEENGSFMVLKRKDEDNKIIAAAFENMIMAHIQDCIWEGSAISCFFCQIGHCQKIHATGEAALKLEKLHREIEDMPKKIVNLA